MDIPFEHVLKVLSEKGVAELYHANSVATACHFLRYRSLLSRGTVERLGLYQTPQQSDDIDRNYGIWFDVFLDSVDIHHRANQANFYGPVLFALDINIITANNPSRIWVTKLNPTDFFSKSF